MKAARSATCPPGWTSRRWSPATRPSTPTWWCCGPMTGPGPCRPGGPASGRSAGTRSASGRPRRGARVELHVPAHEERARPDRGGKARHRRGAGGDRGVRGARERARTDERDDEQRERFVTTFIPKPEAEVISDQVLDNILRERAKVRAIFDGPTIPEAPQHGLRPGAGGDRVPGPPALLPQQRHVPRTHAAPRRAAEAEACRWSASSPRRAAQPEPERPAMAVPALRHASDGARGRCQIFCDGHQHFLFERTRDGFMVERFCSSDPNRFHHYVHDLCAQGWASPGHGTKEAECRPNR